MRARPNGTVSSPLRAKRQREPGSATRLRKVQQPVTSPADEEVDRDEAPDLAQSDIETADERTADSVETLPEMEREIGISDWIDPQTGEPAEGQSPPHLEEG